MNLVPFRMINYVISSYFFITTSLRSHLLNIFCFRCNSCSSRKNIRVNSWFGQFTHCSLPAILRCILHWSSHSSFLNVVCVETNLSKPTVAKICRQLDMVLCRDVNTNQRKLGGLGKFVLLDESFALKPKVSKYTQLSFLCLIRQIDHLHVKNLYHKHCVVFQAIVLSRDNQALWVELLNCVICKNN